MICKKLIEAKDRSGLTNRQIAELSGVPLGTVNRIMSGFADDPKWETVVHIANALNVSTDYLAAGADTPVLPVIEKPSRPEISPSDRFHELTMSILRRQRIEKNVLFGCLIVLVLAILVFVFIDISTVDIGWVRS